MLDSIKKAFALSGRAVKIFGIIAAFNMAVNLINLAVVPKTAEAELSLGASYLVIGLGALFFLLAALMQGGILTYVKDIIKSGSANLASFLTNCTKYFLRVLAVLLLTMLIILGFVVLLHATLPLLPVALKLLVTIIGAIIILAVIVLLIMPVYAVIAGDLGTMAALRKGVTIGTKNFLAILVLLLVLIIIAFVAMLAASFVVGILSIPFRAASQAIAAVVLAITSAYLTVLADIAYMNLYLKKSS